MTTVKIYKSNALGMTILPAFFPVGVLAKRFGLMERVTTSVTRLMDIDNYIILRGDKIVVTPISPSDKNSFLVSFVSRYSDDLEAVNDFTAEYEIYPSDIYKEEDLDLPQRQLLPDNQPIPIQSSATTALLVTDKTERKKDVTPSAIYSEDRSSALNLVFAKNPLNSREEENILKESINYYLIEFGLKPIDKESNQYPIHFVSTKGDVLLNYSLLDYFSERRTLKHLVTNASMQYALGRMGYYEFLEADTHLAGTFFEVIYACAWLQKRQDVVERMEHVLVGDEAFKTKLPSIKFKEQ